MRRLPLRRRNPGWHELPAPAGLRRAWNGSKIGGQRPGLLDAGRVMLAEKASQRIRTAVLRQALRAFVANPAIGGEYLSRRSSLIDIGAVRVLRRHLHLRLALGGGSPGQSQDGPATQGKSQKACAKPARQIPSPIRPQPRQGAPAESCLAHKRGNVAQFQRPCTLPGKPDFAVMLSSPLSPAAGKPRWDGGMRR